MLSNKFKSELTKTFLMSRGVTKYEEKNQMQPAKIVSVNKGKKIQPPQKKRNKLPLKNNVLN